MNKIVSIIFILSIFNPSYAVAITSKCSKSDSLAEVVRISGELRVNKPLAAYNKCFKTFIDHRFYIDASPKVQQRFLWEYTQTLTTLANQSKEKKKEKYLIKIIETTKRYIDWYLELTDDEKNNFSDKTLIIYKKRARRSIYLSADTYKALGKYDKAISDLEKYSASYFDLITPNAINDIWLYLLLRYPAYNRATINDLDEIIDLVEKNKSYFGRWLNFNSYLFDTEKSKNEYSKWARNKLNEYSSITKDSL